MIFDKDREGTGTREWAEHSYNIEKGCKHNCVYCYAKADALNKYHTINNENEWTTTSVNPKKVNKKWNKMDGIIMFPTVHDITEENINECVTVLDNMLKAGNDVLIVSKPCINTINVLTEKLKDYKEHILFRFTIGNTDNKMLELFEPGAPSFEQRLEALKIAFNNGFKTSVSIEPLLGGIKELTTLYEFINLYVTDSIWVGKMNKIDERVIINSDKLEIAIKYIKECQTDDKITKIYITFKDMPHILWKDSIKEVVNK